jgi:protein transport protein SEC31
MRVLRSDSKVFVVNLQNPGSPSVAAPDVLAHSVEPPREITSVAWNSQVAHILATATQSGSCLVWDLRTNKPWCQLKDASRSPFSSVSWNPIDGLYIVTGMVA